MLNSMTGYGRYEQIDDKRKIVIDIRSVNHRYSDVTVKLPRAYGYLEDKIREYVLANISRGKVDVFIYIENYTSDDKEIILDETLCRNYFSLLEQIKETCNIKQDITVSDMTRFSDMFITKQQEEDKEQVWQMFLECLEPALNDFLSARRREGERLLPIYAGYLHWEEIVWKGDFQNIIEPEYFNKVQLKMASRIRNPKHRNPLLIEV